MSDRPCTCHPDDNPPVPCPQKFALSECKAAPKTVAQAWKLVPVNPTMGMYDDWNAVIKNGPSDGVFGAWIAAYRAMLAAAPAAPVPETVAWIEHHKAGDNLLWDEPGGKKTPLYAHPAPVAAPAPDDARDAPHIAPFRSLVAACNRLSYEAEEYTFDDGMGRGALQSYWDEFESALERAREALT